MAEDEKEVLDQTDAQTPDLPQEEEIAEDVQEQEVDYRGKLNATNHFLRKEGYEYDDAKKQWTKKAPATDKKPSDLSQDTQISQTDMYALVRANVPEEDVSEVVDYAKLKGITIAQALKTPVIKTILSEKAEERTTADATHVAGSARGSAKVSTEKLLADAKKGIMPDSDADMQRLVEAQMERPKK
jgi:hypothetical protein